MLKVLGIIALALLATGCSDEPAQPVSPLAIEADYELLYNETLVGNALFTLAIGADGGYRLEAFTVPAGTLQRQGNHEVLETSAGYMDREIVRPLRYSESVLRDDELQAAGIAFDWASGSVQVTGPAGQRTAALLPGTHDRLSYLLVAHRLAAQGEGSGLIRVATPEASEESRLEFIGADVVALPIGEFDAVAVRRITPDTGATRQLWFATPTAPLPVRVLQDREGNKVEMRLAGISRQ